MPVSFGKLGWVNHIYTIQSHEKCTCGGMNFTDSDTKVLDQVLPARFGGSPTDFQILEEENEDGVPVLKLLVRPSFEFLNEDEVIETFIRGISRGADANRVIGTAWRSAGLLRVERREPLSTRSGNILHMHVKSGGEFGP